MHLNLFVIDMLEKIPLHWIPVILISGACLLALGLLASTGRK